MSPPGPDEIAATGRALWSGGRYEAVAEHLRSASRELVEAYPPMRRALADLISSERTGHPAAVIDSPWLLVIGTRA